MSAGRDRLLVLAAGLGAALPAIASTVAGLDAGWVAYGDRGVIAVRAHDVLSGQSPLLGQHSSSSLPGRPTYGLGPLLFWLLALPARLGSEAIVIAAGLVNVVSAMGTVALAHRRRGLPFMFAVALAVVVMCGSLPPEALHDIWNPYIAMLPFTLLIFLCWSLACGDGRLLPATVVVASFVAQCHLALVLPAAALVAIGVGGLALSRRRAGGGGAPPLRRAGLAAAVVVLVCWAGPIVDQATNRPGNAVELVRSAGDQGATVGLDTGWDAVARTAGVPPWWLGSGMDVGDRLEDLLVGPGTFQELTALALLLALAAAGALALRRRDHDTAAMAAIGLALLLALALVVAATPTRDALANTLGYSVDWGAPAGMWLYVALAVAVLALLPRPPRSPGLAPRALPAIGVGAVAVLGLAVALSAGDDSDESRYQPIRTVLRAVERDLDRPGSVEVKASPTALGFDFQAALVYELRRDGRDARSAALAERLGGHHGVGADEPEYVVSVQEEGVPLPPIHVAARVTVSLPPVQRGGPPVERLVVVTVAYERDAP